MKKSFIITLTFAIIFILAACGTGSSGNSSVSEPNEPREIPIETVTELIRSAEAVYQLGNYDVFTLAQFEIQFIDGENISYYDEISNYEKVAPTIFTDNGIKVLEESRFLGSQPIIVKKDGKVYRASSMSDSAATVFFRTISSIELVRQHDNIYVYKVMHITEPRWIDEAVSMESTVTIAEEDGKFLIDEFTYPLAVSAQSVDAEKLVQDFSSSVTFCNETGSISFTIPQGLLPEYSFYIHVSGRVKMGDGGMSFHLFEEESESNNWEPGKTYHHEFGTDALLEALITVGVQEHVKTEILFETQINIDESGNIKRSDISEQIKQDTITFPVSDNGKTEFNAHIFEIEPFSISPKFPDGWRLREREPVGESEAKIALFGVWSKLDIFNEKDERVGAIGYNTFDLYEGAEDDPRAIYNQIALGNDYHFDVRDSYKVVNKTDSGTTAITDVYYAASINGGVEKTNKGIVSYNKDLLVYIAAEFDTDKITDEQLIDIAKSIQIP